MFNKMKFMLKNEAKKQDFVLIIFINDILVRKVNNKKKWYKNNK